MITFYHDIEQNFDSNANAMECRKMVYEFLKLEKKYNISSTYNVVGKLFIEQPDLIEMILKEGQEVAFHSYNHFRDWKPEYFSNEISLCRKVSPIPKGYRSPRSQINKTAVQTLWDEGFYWTAERDQHSEPYYIYKGLIRLPITADDWPLYEGKVTSVEWVQKFNKLVQNRSYVAFGLHDFVATKNPEEILKAWEKILQIAVTKKALIMTFTETADLFRRATNSKNILLNNHINEINKDTFPKEFDELIKIEISNLSNPKVAFLCYRYEELPDKYREIIEKNNYLVVESGSSSRNDIGNESSRLNSIDLLICTDTIEYTYLPECLAGEIKKMCKIGASLIVKFSHSIDNEFATTENRLGIMNLLYTPAQIIKWSNQIGSGFLVRLDNEKLDSQKYSRNKSNHFVYVGKVQNINSPQQNNRIIPLSRAGFHFPNSSIERYKINLENTGLKLIKPIKEIVRKVLLHS
jgi:peptidoglycan/xylan/chitin deacetylase (PgdA/CDA1 family)